MPMAEAQAGLRHESRGCLRHLRALLLYALLACLLTWPLVAHLSTHVTGDGIDDPALAWNLWWLKARLVDQHRADIFHVDWMFYPLGINLGFYTLTPLNGLLSVPLQVAANLIVANNLLLLLSYVLGGYGSYLLVLDQFRRTAKDVPAPEASTASEWSALFAGFVFAFASSKLFYASLGQFNIASGYWIPFCVLYTIRAGDATDSRTGMRAAALAGLFLVFQSWAELTYASFLLIFIGLHIVWRLLLGRPAGRSFGLDWVQLGSRYLLTGVIFAIGIAPFLWAMVPDLRREGDFFGSGGGFADTFSADLMGYLVPTRLHPLLGEWVATLPFPNDKGQHIFVGYTVVVLALLGLVAAATSRARATRRLALFWGAAGLIFWLLTLGPEWRWAGESLGIPGPFALVSRLPFFSGNRYPSRYSVMLMLCAAVLAGGGLRWLLLRIRGRDQSQEAAAAVSRANRADRVGAALVLFLALATLGEHLAVPLPLNDLRIPPPITTLADSPGAATDAGTLLELPTGWRNGARVLGKSDVVIMMQQWYQTEHGLRRLGGNTSRNPDYKFQYFTEAPLLGELTALMNADESTLAGKQIVAEVTATYDELVARNRPLAAPVLDFLDVNEVLIYVDHAPPLLLQFVADVLPLTLEAEWQGADWQGRPSTLRLYRVHASTAPRPWLVDLASEVGKLYLAEGWSALASTPAGVRYALRPTAELMLDLPTAGGELVLELRGPAAEVVVALNGRTLGTYPLSSDSAHEVAISIPAGLAREPVDRLRLHFTGDGAAAPALAPSPDAAGWPIGASGHYLAEGSSVVVRSAGADVGDFAQILVNGVEVVAADERSTPGYHLVALNRQGDLLQHAQFDTFADEAASTALAAWTAQWPEGTIVAGAVADEASASLDEVAIAALRQLGVDGDLRGRFRWSHAFVGVVGARPGTVPEAMSLLQPASVAIGPSATGSTAYGGVGRIYFTPAP